MVADSRLTGRTILSGRIRALAAVEAARGLTVVTGSPGAGKSAVIRQIAPDAVRVRGKTALEVAAEVARAASIRPRPLDDLVAALQARSEGTRSEPVRLVLDGLDEAADPGEARLLLPLVRACGHAVVGTRRVDDGGDLVRELGRSATIVDLDTPEYFDRADLRAHLLAMVGDPATAARIADLAGSNFLVAELMTTVDPDRLDFDATVDEAFKACLARLDPAAAAALTPLAYAPGLTRELWEVALGTPVPHADLGVLVEGGHGRYRLRHQALEDALLAGRKQDRGDDERALAARLIEHGRRTGWRDTGAYLPALAARAGMIDALLTDAVYLLHADLARLGAVAWQAATDDGRERARLLRLTPHAATAAPPERAAMIGVTAEVERLANPYAGWRGLPYRVRWASVPGRAERSALEGHDGPVRALCTVRVGGRPHLATAGEFPYLRLWDPASGRHRDLPLPAERFLALCAVTVNDRTRLAAAGDSGRISFVDPAGGGRSTLTGPATPVRALATITVGGQPHLVAGGDDGMVRMWSLADGRSRTFLAHAGAIRAIAAVPSGTRQVLLTAGDDFAARIWDPVTGRALRTLDRHVDSVRAACALTAGGHGLLATANYNDLSLWNLGKPGPPATLKGHRQAIRGMTTMTADGRPLVATGAADGDVRIWDPATGKCLRVLSGHTDAVNAICTVTVDGQVLLATGGRDRTARLWETGTSEVVAGRVSAAATVGNQLATVDRGRIRVLDVATGTGRRTLGGMQETITALCTVDHLVVSATGSGLVQTWDPRPGRQQRATVRRFDTLQAIGPYGRDLLAVVGQRRLYLYRPDTDKIVSRHQLGGLPRGVRAVAQAGDLLATAGDGDVQLWTAGGTARGTLAGHRGVVRALTTAAGLLASAGDDRTVRLWDPATRRCLATLTGHRDVVGALTPILAGDRPMLVSGSRDRTLRVWDLTSYRLIAVVPVHHPVLACAEASGLLFVGLITGSLTLDLANLPGV